MNPSIPAEHDASVALLEAAKICDQLSNDFTADAIADYEKGEISISRWSEAMAEGAEKCAEALRARAHDVSSGPKSEIAQERNEHDAL